jgi:beta-phosphoglucomutase
MPPKPFYLLDLDGTLVDSDRLHYEAYAAVLAPRELTWSTFEKAISDSSTEVMLEEMGFTKEESSAIRQAKKTRLMEMIRTPGVLKFIPGADTFLQYCLDHEINFVIVTNTPSNVVECMRDALPLLRAVPNWIVREDYTHPKPDSDCYRVALERFGKNNDGDVIGVENTLNGFRALKGVASIRYLIAAQKSYTAEEYFAILNREDTDREILYSESLDREDTDRDSSEEEDERFSDGCIFLSQSIGEIEPDTGTYSQPHCCCCDLCDNRPNGCPHGWYRVH